jgi:hypothetical protein
MAGVNANGVVVNGDITSGANIVGMIATGTKTQRIQRPLRSSSGLFCCGVCYKAGVSAYRRQCSRYPAS